MSGFLQQLAAGAARPAQRLHPFAGSIFQRGREETAGQTPGEPVEESVARRVIPPDADTAAPANPSEQGRYERVAEKPDQRWSQADRSATQKTGALLVARQPTLVEMPSVRETESTAPPHAAEEPRFSAAADVGRGALRFGEPPAAGPSALHPLLVPRSPADPARGDELPADPPSPERSAANSPLVPLNSQVPSTRTAAARQQSPERSGGSGRDHTADDIQINIGRIEVIAVPPAPAPRRTPAPRTAPNLAQYLKRRAGRGS
jgi:hypothetical protein